MILIFRYALHHNPTMFSSAASNICQDIFIKKNHIPPLFLNIISEKYRLIQFHPHKFELKF